LQGYLSKYPTKITLADTLVQGKTNMQKTIIMKKKSAEDQYSELE